MKYRKLNVKPGEGKAEMYRTTSANQMEYAEYLCPHSGAWTVSGLWRNGDLPRAADQFEMVVEQ